jgi:cysteinyl-tRNA synthetase
MYQTKYENPVNFSDELLNASANEIEKITNHIGNAIVQLKLGGISIATTNGKMSAEFIKAMENDLDFPLAVSEI